MASILHGLTRRPVLGGAALTSAIVTVYLVSRPTETPERAFRLPDSFLLSRQLRVSGVEQINHDSKRIAFQLPGGQDEVSGVPSGAAILVQHTPKGAWFPVLRPYTPINESSEHGVLLLLVKQYPGGRASTYLHSLSPGDTVTARGPLSGYPWKPSYSPRSVIFVAGGAGITPIYSLTKAVLSDPSDRTKIELLWGVNGTRDIVLKDELEKLKSVYPERLRVTYLVSGPEGKPDAPDFDDKNYKKGYINREILQEAIQRNGGKDNIGNEAGMKVWFCGPPKMQEAIAGRQGALTQLELSKKEIHCF